ncbi:MAG: hypothetical protein IAE91_07820 [Ignavibacteriaceae bacterium]|nr:hypothetical protein [Ignavibacteriaceae bacterium]
MASLIEIRDKISINTGVEGSEFFPPLRLNDIINNSAIWLGSKLVSLGVKRYETQVNITSLLTNSDFGGIEVKTVEVNESNFPGILLTQNPLRFIEVRDNSSRKGIAIEISSSGFDDLCKNEFTKPSINNSFFCLESGKIFIAPATIVQATAHYNRKIIYAVNNTAQIDLPDYLIPFLVKKCVAEIKGILGNQLQQGESDEEIISAIRQIMKGNG